MRRSLWPVVLAAIAAGTRLDVSNQRYAMTVEPSVGEPRPSDVAERHVVVCVQR